MNNKKNGGLKVDRKLALLGMLSEQLHGDQLTNREHQILLAALEGLDSIETSRQLGISPRTVESHRTNIISKCGVSSMCELFRILALNGMRG